LSAIVIDGKKISEDVRDEVATRVERLAARGIAPGLAVVQVGDDPASSIYVRNKRRTCKRLGIRSFAHDLPADTSEADLVALIDQLNGDPSVHGILIQLPLPDHVDSDQIIVRIAPEKDVDGFHPMNAGLLATGGDALTPCTPTGVIEMLRRSDIPIEGRHAVVIGRSNIVGKPMAQLLLKENATVTMAHSRTHDLPALARTADILVVAVGRAEFVKRDWVKPGAVVIDVGIQRNEAGRLVGDVAFEEILEVAGHATPVPGGVGPMTIAMLMHNTTVAAERAASRSEGQR
jgi:methylenetetrahydrofolate dehydrogenase (NADP+)/methenyltetrahydrofolate cyclohydrolase